MKSLFFSVPIFMAFSLLGFCNKEQMVSPQQGATATDTVEIAFQHTVSFPPDNFQVRFDTVLSDSRCPSDVECIWAGRADVQLTVTLGAQSQTLALGVGPQGPGFPPSSTVVFGRTVQLIDVLPYPISTSTIDPEDYVIQVGVN